MMKRKTKKTIRYSLIAVCSLLLLGSLMPGTFTEEILQNDFIKGLKEKLSEYNEHKAEDKVYLQFDKTLYKPGETIWFSAYVRNGEDLKPSRESEILYAELIDPKGNVSKKLNLIARNGTANAEFDIDKYAMGGIYKVKAYTNWQKNDDLFFEKELQVQKVVLPNLKMKLDFQRKAYGPGDDVIAKVNLNTLENQPLADYEFKYAANLNGAKLLEKKFTTDNTGEAYVKFQLPEDLKTNDGLLNVMIDYEGKTESISRSIPITLGNIDLTFFPEGGDLVEGLETKVAFKAINEFGKPADIEGTVLDRNGKEVASFKSFHNGMGSFEFEPKIGMEYTAKITNPKGIDKEYNLPDPMRRGWVLNVEHKDHENLKVIINSTENEQMSLVCQIRGKVYFSRALEVTRGRNETSISLAKFPIGVAQITLFDGRDIERAERMVFVNKDKQMHIEIKTDKEKYLPREKVRMTINVTDERGLPIPANLSLAVVDDKLLTFADDKSGNILSHLLLESDIKSKVEEPAFYFDLEEEKADEALDYLLMTDGWRRFNWEEVLSDQLPAISYLGEKAAVTGKVMDYNGQPVTSAAITVNGKGGKFRTDKSGRFELNNVDLYQQTYLNISADDYTAQNVNVYGYNQPLNVYLYDHTYYKRYSKSKAHRGVGGARMPMAAGAALPVDRMRVVKDVEMVMMNKEEANFDLDMVPMAEPVAVAQKVALNKQDDKVMREDKDLKKRQADVLIDGEVGLMAWDFRGAEKPVVANQTYYHRAREFAAPEYNSNEEVDIRSDFRSTIYWNGNIEVGSNGRAKVEFCNSDEVTSFRATVEGVGIDLAGRAEKTYFTQLPFSMYAKIPAQVITEDVVHVPLTLKNNTDKTVTGILTINVPKGFKAVKSPAVKQTLLANSVRTIYLDYTVLNKPGEDRLEIAFKANGLKDAFVQNIKIGSKGFPVSLAFSGQEVAQEYTVNISNMVNGSLTASLTAYPSVVNDLMSGIESLIREPSGCFEQTSMSNYPNIMAMNYMQETEYDDASLLASIEPKLDRGYKRLVSYETKEKGYEWFGSSPGHEALTAYGLMQFNDMKKVYDDVDNKMVERTASWLLSRRNGKGGFKKNPRALDQFGRASDDVTTSYIVYALSEAGSKEVSKELENAYSSAIKSNDAYQLALVASALFNFKDKRADEVLKKLLKLQTVDGSWNSDHSITRSGGKSLQIETTALSVLAILKSIKKDQGALTKGVEFLIGSRSGYGGFGSTQGTVLALKALTGYASFSKKTDEAGTIQCFVDGKLVASQHYEAGERDAITFEGLSKHLGEGKHKIKVKYIGVQNPMPYTVAIDYHTTLPESASECNVDIKTKLASRSCKVGETVRLTTTVANLQKKGMPMTMAVVGIPSGLSAQPWQLKELQEKGRVDFYEITDNYVIFYFRDMAPSETHIINLDLKAEVPGEFDAPASSGYLYYTNEYKCWTSTGKITIRK